jgi:hypothetical protein
LLQIARFPVAVTAPTQSSGHGRCDLSYIGTGRYFVCRYIGTGQHFVCLVPKQLQNHKRQNADCRQPKRKIEKRSHWQPSVVGQLDNPESRFDIVG